jgi:predicted RNA binding protein YcfA (HicA-like mRNA interferase family)
MPPFGVISRKDLIKFLKKYGFEGPYSGGRHQFMIKGDSTLRIPNPHQSDIGKSLLIRILRQANISKDAWEKL